jgi:phytoene synthase
LKAGNFYHGFRLLPRAERLGTCALYAFLRVADDIADADVPAEQRRRSLRGWREQLSDALVGQFSHPLHAALEDTVKRFRIPTGYLELALDGVGMDLEIRRYETFDDLYAYCYRVASVVGLACIHIWGYQGESAKKYAEAAGIAFQLTNILRDLAEDVAHDRIYLPRCDLSAFAYTENDLRRGVRDRRFTELMEFQARRAHKYYEEGERLLPHLSPPGRAVFLVMMRTYRGLLEAMERLQYDVFSRRIRLSRCRKLWFALRALPVRCGWRSKW